MFEKEILTVPLIDPMLYDGLRTRSTGIQYVR